MSKPRGELAAPHVFIHCLLSENRLLARPYCKGAPKAATLQSSLFLPLQGCKVPLPILLLRVPSRSLWPLVRFIWPHAFASVPLRTCVFFAQLSTPTCVAPTAKDQKVIVGFLFLWPFDCFCLVATSPVLYASGLVPFGLGSHASSL